MHRIMKKVVSRYVPPLARRQRVEVFHDDASKFFGLQPQKCLGVWHDVVDSHPAIIRCAGFRSTRLNVHMATYEPGLSVRLRHPTRRSHETVDRADSDPVLRRTALLHCGKLRSSA